jgi:hypothetical protein
MAAFAWMRRLMTQFRASGCAIWRVRAASARRSRPGAASSRPGGADLVITSLLVAHGGVPGAIAEGTIAVAVVALFVAIWLRERRSGEEQGRLNDERRRDRE